jgi:hypothetical protein
MITSSQKIFPQRSLMPQREKYQKIPLHDFNCGLKAYRKKVVKSIEVYGEMHRNIPVLAKWAGFRKIGEKVVEHRPRKYGVTKFGWDRFINGFLDLSTLTFVGRFSKRPMHFFGPVWNYIFYSWFTDQFLPDYCKDYKYRLWLNQQAIFLHSPRCNDNWYASYFLQVL